MKINPRNTFPVLWRDAAIHFGSEEDRGEHIMVATKLVQQEDLPFCTLGIKFKNYQAFLENDESKLFFPVQRTITSLSLS